MKLRDSERRRDKSDMRGREERKVRRCLLREREFCIGVRALSFELTLPSSSRFSSGSSIS